MPLESATYVSGLNSSNPVTGDDVNKGDDHIRLVKQTLVNSFPAVSGAVTASHTELSYADGVTSAIQTQIDSKAAKAGDTFSGPVEILGGGATTDPQGRITVTLPSDGNAYAAYGIVRKGSMAACLGIDTGNALFFGVGTGGTLFNVSTRTHRFDLSGGAYVAEGLIYGRGGGAGLGQITISTSDPSGGADGDIWLKVA
jgi:hypothetical protein